MRPHVLPTLLALALVLPACGDDDGSPPLDAGPDASAETGAPDGASDDGAGGDAARPDAGPPAEPAELTSAHGWTLRVETDPLAFSLRDPAGEVLASAPGRPALLLGQALDAPRPERFYDPRPAEAPRGVAYVPAGTVYALEREPAALHGRVDTAAGPVTLDIDVDEPADDVAVFHVVARAASDGRVVLVRLALDAGEPTVGYYGLGELFDGAETRGRVIPMQLMVGGTSSGTNERHVPVPFLVSTRGPGLFVRSRESGAFDVASSDPAVVSATFEGDSLDLSLVATRAPLRAAEEHTRLTGRPRLPPLWAFGNMQWRNEWASADEVRSDLDRYRAERFPLSVMWIDNPWQTSYNDLLFDTARFPDPAGLVAELGARGVATFLWSTPYLDALDDDDAGLADADNEAERLFVRARDEGWLIQQSAGGPWITPGAPGASGGMIDFTNPAAEAFWVGRVAPLVALGIRGFKLDFAEDVLPELLGTRPGLVFSDGSTDRQLHGYYALLYQGAYRRALDEGAGGDGVIIGRASVWGGQSVVDVIWPGDLDNDFRRGGDGEVGGLPASVSAVQSLAASGFPSFAADTGGFREGMPAREALLRWAEHTALTPIFQLGGAGQSHNPWEYDDETVQIMGRLMRLHMDLVPYLRVQALRASNAGTPPVRALGLQFPDDPAAVAAIDEYLLGDALLVAPVVDEGASGRSVHVPEGRWVRWQDGAEQTGPGDARLGAPLGTPIVLVREGAVVPLLAADVETLLPTDDPSVVDLADRARYRRVRIVPGTDGESMLEEGAIVRLTSSDPGAAVIELDPAGSGIDRWILELDVAATAVEIDGVAAAPAADLAEVEAYCDRCWTRRPDGAARTRVGVHGAARVSVR